jgi:hypothetical protein
MTENSAEVEELMESFQREKTLSGLDKSQVKSLDIEAESQKIFQKIITMVPGLAAKIIAVASDAPEDADFIRANFVLPLQFEALAAIAQLTFIDSNGFKRFLGNVLALIESGNVNGQRQLASGTPTRTHG